MTEGHALNKMPVKEVLKINKNQHDNEQNIILDAIKIENRFKKVKIELNNQSELIFLKKNSIVKNEEFDQLKFKYFSDEESIDTLELRLNKIDDLYKELRDQEIEKIIELTPEVNVDLNFSKKYPETSAYLKTYLLKQLSEKYFGRTVSEVKEKIVDQIELDSHKIAFLYFSTNAVEILKLSKINEIVNNQGHVFKIQEVFQSHENFCFVYQKDTGPINISIPVFYGIIVCGEK
jgi:hypothetical protein